MGTRHLAVIVLTHAHRTADPGEGSSSREKSLSPSVTLERRASAVGRRVGEGVKQRGIPCVPQGGPCSARRTPGWPRGGAGRAAAPPEGFPRSPL